MRAHRYIKLDLEHQEFLTDGKGQMVNDPEGQPYRIAHCVASNEVFVRIAEHQEPHASGGHPRFGKLSDKEMEKRRERIEAHKPIYVPGHGHWIPLKELPGFEEPAP